MLIDGGIIRKSVAHLIDYSWKISGNLELKWSNFGTIFSQISLSKMSLKSDFLRHLSTLLPTLKNFEGSKPETDLKCSGNTKEWVTQQHVFNRWLTSHEPKFCYTVSHKLQVIALVFWFIFSHARRRPKTLRKV